MACIWAGWMFAGLSTAARRETSRSRSLSGIAVWVKAADRLSARVAMVASEGLLAPCALARRSFLSCCFCVDVTGELGLKAARSAFTLARFCCRSGDGAVEAIGAADWLGGFAWLGGVTPCRTLFWSRISLARCLIMTSGPAKALPATSVAAPINARTIFISLSAVLTRLLRAEGTVNLT